MTELPPGWVGARIGEVAQVNPRPSIEAQDDELVSFVPMEAVEADTGVLDPSRTVRFGDLKKKSYRRFEEADVVVAKITPSMENGKAALARGLIGRKAFGSTELHVLRPGDGLDPRYLLHFLLQKSFRANAARHMTGTAGQLRVPVSYLHNAPLPLPSLVEQRRIVELIEELFSGIEAGTKALQRAKDNVARMRTAALRHVFRFEEWSTVPLGEIADVVGGVPKDQKRETAPFLLEVPYLRVANVQRGYLDLNEIKTMRVASEKADSLALQPGDLLFTEGGDRDKLGRGWVWEGQISHCIHQNHVFRARLVVDEFEPRFVSLYANAFGQDWFRGMGKQTTNLASISLSALKRFPVPALAIDHQKALLAEVERQSSFLDNTEQAIDSSLGRASALRQRILRDAFTGCLLRRDLSDETQESWLHPAEWSK